MGYLLNQCPQKGTVQPGVSANSDTDVQKIEKRILQRVIPEQVSSNLKKVQAEADFGPTFYVMYDLVGQKHKTETFFDTGSNVKSPLKKQIHSVSSVSSSDLSENKFFRPRIILFKYSAFLLRKYRSRTWLK